MSVVDRNNIETQHDLEGLPRHIALTATSLTYQMRVSDTVVIAKSTTGNDGTGIITLPSLAEAVGKFYFISAPTGLGGDDVSVYEKETGAEYAGSDTDDGDLDANDDHIIIFSDGTKWRTVLNGVEA